ncbi:MAG: DUF6279 family lipoprotein [Burkholderiaceae bacterium]
MSTSSLWRRIICLLALPVITGLLGGCSAIKIGYGAAPEAIYLWLNGYVEINDTQSPKVKEDLSRLLQWHRAQELPRYAALLDEVEQLAMGEIAAPRACVVAQEVRARIQAVSNQAEPALVTLATSMTPEQIAHLQRRFERDDATWRKDWLDAPPARRLDKRVKSWVDRIESIYGSLDERQRTLVRQQLTQSGWDVNLTWAERQRRQRDVLQVLREVNAPGTAPIAARRQVRALLDRVQSSPDPAWQRHRDAMQAEGCALFAALHASTSTAQRESAARRMRAYARDLRELAAAR